MLTYQAQANHDESKGNPPYLQNRAPLQQKPFLDLPFGAIRPAGWLRQQLVDMKNGMAGRLDQLYPSVLGSRNGWLGGDGDVWERGPYWLDGLVPLAYILDDDELKAKVRPWVEWSIANQMKDGYFGPIPPVSEPAPEAGLQRDRARDWWPKMVMMKVLQQYYTATGDKRVIELLLRYTRYQLQMLPRTPLGFYSWWGSQRGADNLQIVYWLYNVTGEAYLLDLAEIIHRQTFDWTDNFLHSNDLAATYKFHGVNLAQGIKSPVIYYQQRPERQYLEAVSKALKDIRLYQGQVQGMYGADELTRGNDPVQGSELCSAVELMFSLESMMTITGDVGMMDHLERIAYNALPAQITDDYNGRQYYQQANQVEVSRQNRNFVTAYDGTDLCFGVLTGFPCCTTNMHQGWPKFVQNLWHASADGGLAALVYGPSSVKARIADGTEVEFTEETSYPFNEQVRFIYNSEAEASFPLHLRVPGWCAGATIRVNGKIYMQPKGGQIERVVRKWKKGDVVELQLPMSVTTSRWFNNSVGVERGPLVYALKVEENWKDVANTDRYGDYQEVYPGSPWNFGLWQECIKHPETTFRVIEKPNSEAYPWNPQNAPVEIRAKGKQIPEWKLYNGSAGPLPYSTIEYLKESLPVNITLIPYGCTTLRISEFPVVL
ncbi:beta-L-arabinofuranosidase domain-containing protein [Puia sp. P3]|uniref:beta-L-arabinofuranosidase domain-containing protein n=1 Tax=Puia sp. P3 TaxID=3423952 RepID=UPI003D679CA2